VKINDPVNTNVSSLQASKLRAPATAKSDIARTGKASQQQDRIQLSGVSNHVALLRSDSAAQRSKLEQLEAKVAQGSYRVNPEAVSASIIQQHAA